jgi:hypothetical protein
MAEFYSANLATEVRKGMQQKAKAGGCVYKAPVGYKNVRELVGGRNVAKVVLDEPAAALVHLAYRLYANGNHSLTEIQEVMDERGLRTVHSKAKPPQSLSKTAITRMLSNRFYLGFVAFKGVEYPGQHDAIISQELFGRVQETMRARDASGERKRKHVHYLKGTLYCGECGGRMSYALAKGRYEYFYCLGQKKGLGCSQSYADATRIEKAVEGLYSDIEISPEWATKLRTRLEEETVARSASSLKEKKSLTKKVDDLTGEQYKLMQAYYAEAVPLEMLKVEQVRLSAEIMLCEERLKTLNAQSQQAERVLELAIKLAGSCQNAYRKARPDTRRLFNQAFFEAIYIEDKELKRAQRTELFDALLSESSDKSSLEDLVERYANTTHLVDRLEACCNRL